MRQQARHAPRATGLTGQPKGEHFARGTKVQNFAAQFRGRNTRKRFAPSIFLNKLFLAILPESVRRSHLSPLGFGLDPVNPRPDKERHATNVTPCRLRFLWHSR